MNNEILQRILRRFAYALPGGYTTRPFLNRLRGVKIGKNVWISQYVYIDEIHPDAVSIGDNTTIGLGCLIIAHLYWGPKRKLNAGKVCIGKDVFLGPHCVVLPNVKIGDGAVIQAGSVVSREIPPGTLWGPPRIKPLAKVTVPLTHKNSFDLFMKGIRPLGYEDSGM